MALGRIAPVSQNLLKFLNVATEAFDKGEQLDVTYLDLVKPSIRYLIKDYACNLNVMESVAKL